MNDFLALLSSYAMFTTEEQTGSFSAYEDGTSGPKDPAKRRDARIQAHRLEKQLREQISVNMPKPIFPRLDEAERRRLSLEITPHHPRHLWRSSYPCFPQLMLERRSSPILMPPHLSIMTSRQRFAESDC